VAREETFVIPASLCGHFRYNPLRYAELSIIEKNWSFAGSDEGRPDSDDR